MFQKIAASNSLNFSVINYAWCIVDKKFLAEPPWVLEIRLKMLWYVYNEFLLIIIFTLHSLTGYVDLVLYTEGIQVQYNLYISDQMYLKTTLLFFCCFFLGWDGGEVQCQKATIQYTFIANSHLLIRKKALLGCIDSIYNVHIKQILGTSQCL